MAIPTNAKYAVILVENEWSDFEIKQNGKDILLFGFNGKTDWFSGEKEIQFLKSIEQSKDGRFNEILDDGYDEDGKRYLLINRS